MRQRAQEVVSREIEAEYLGGEQMGHFLASIATAWDRISIVP